MKKRLLHSLAILSLAAAAVPARATVVFSDDFDTDHTANWTFTTSSGLATLGDTANDGAGSEANVFYDYSQVGVPSVNGPGGSTTGMKFVANLGTSIFSGVTMGLNTQTFDFVNKSYKISAKVWLNYYGGTTAGTTEEVMMGIGANAGTSQFVGDNFNSVMFATSTDGDTTSDWRAYKTPWPVDSAGTILAGSTQRGESGVYAADPTGSIPGNSGTGNDLDSASSTGYYINHFPGGERPPQVQQDLFPAEQTSNVGMPASPGTVAFAWHTWTIESTLGGGPITFSVDGVPIATIQGGTINPYTLSGNSIYFGIFDINTTGTASGVHAESLLFGLVDNVMVEDVTLYGDANLNGVIDADDFALIDRGFAMTLTGFTNGDFNGSGVIDTADYLLIDTAYAQQTGGLSPGFLAEREAQFGDAYVQSLLASVPEPASASLLALAAAPLLRRRNRSSGL